MTISTKIGMVKDLLLKFYNNPSYTITYLQKLYACLKGTDIFITKYKKLNIPYSQDSLKILMKSDKSFVRFGDGEMDLMLGSSIYFDKWHQKYDPELAKRLREVFTRCDIYVGLMKPYLLQTDAQLKRNNVYLIWVQTRYLLHKYLNKNQKYLDGLVFRENKDLDIESLFAYLNNYSVVLVTSQEKSYDLLKHHVKNCHFIQTPVANAWDHYNDIVKDVKSTIKKHKLKPKKTLFLLSVGPTAKPLVIDITDMGYRAWDSGHFFQMYCKQLEELKGKHK